MYAGGPNSVRGFRQNELGPAIYVINSLAAIDTIPIPGHDTLAFFRASPDRGRPTVVPTGGDNMVVANTELRLRSFFLPDLVQWAVFVDAGQVWNRGRRGTGIDFARFRVTPGIGARYFSLVGPIRVDVGYNPYARPAGAAYYNPLVEGGFQSTGDLRLICVSPNNSLRVRLGNPDPQNRTPPQQIDRGDCPATYPPARSRTFFSRLTLNLSIGQPF
jgi:outer membrane protein insertion porin family/translocation and assembly module TamA